MGQAPPALLARALALQLQGGALLVALGVAAALAEAEALGLPEALGDAVALAEGQREAEPCALGEGPRLADADWLLLALTQALALAQALTLGDAEAEPEAPCERAGLRLPEGLLLALAQALAEAQPEGVPRAEGTLLEAEGEREAEAQALSDGAGEAVRGCEASTVGRPLAEGEPVSEGELACERVTGRLPDTVAAPEAEAEAPEVRVGARVTTLCGQRWQSACWAG